jgi:NADH-quinone oxidoreductase subunit A
MEPWLFVVYLFLIVMLVGIMLTLSYVLGQRHSERATGLPYESGIVSEGSARVRISTQFYLIAVIFVVFDLETVFIVAWAIAGRELGWSGYWEMIVFVGILIAALAYLWKRGALDWGPERGISTSGDRA